MPIVTENQSHSDYDGTGQSAHSLDASQSPLFVHTRKHAQSQAQRDWPQMLSSLSAPVGSLWIGPNRNESVGAPMYGRVFVCAHRVLGLRWIEQALLLDHPRYLLRDTAWYKPLMSGNR